MKIENVRKQKIDFTNNSKIISEMSVYEYGENFILNHNSPKISQPTMINLFLKDHQKASVERIFFSCDKIKSSFLTLSPFFL